MQSCCHGRKRSDRHAAGKRWQAPFSVLLAVCVTAVSLADAFGCPFCGVVGPSLAERRDRAAAVAVGVPDGSAADLARIPARQEFRIDQVLRGDAPVGELVTADVTEPCRGTALLFGTPAEGNTLRWSALEADEALLGHVAAAPPVALPNAERLRWFARRLEHPAAAIAADAFAEFGRADFTDVRAAAHAVDPASLRAWVTEPGIDGRRRGLYGLLLGVAAVRAGDSAVAGDCVAALHRAVEAPADEFRAGFDGVLAGVLVAEGPRGLDFLRRRGLFAATARPMDQRHLLAALRFAGESLGDSLPPDAVAAATARLLMSPAVAADAVVDLARYRWWGAVDDVAALWDALGGDDPLVRRAVAGYLAACPEPAARRHLDRLRREDPRRLEQALEAAALPAR